ncbi:MAG: hypothetical protein ACI4PU_05715 [Intestinibacter sp.]
MSNNIETSFDISEGAEDKLRDMSFTEPYLLYEGSYKEVENGKVYIYESKQEGDKLIFTKYNESRDKIVERIKLKIDGDEVTIDED